jgi:erythronate-4-phosphate dehydrogenase
MNTMPNDVHIVVNKHTPYAEQVFKRIGKVTALDTHEITSGTVKDADILIVRSETKVNEALLKGSRVKFVGTVTIGKDHVDEVYLAKNGITFISAPGSNSNSVSEYLTAALLELAKRKNFLPGEKTIGIVGVGNVGSKVWRKAEALGMRVLLNDPPLQRQGSAYPLQSLDALMDADILTLHVPLQRTGQDATYHLFDERRIRSMKKGAIFINTSRGGVVETEGLKHAILDGHLSNVVLDVWEKEPTIDASLLDLVSLGTQHIAGHSLDGKVNALRMNYESVCRFLSLPVDQELIPSFLDRTMKEIKINARSGSLESVLREIVKQCYDITEDDRLLRRIVSVPEQDRGKYFSRLRTEYRIRREFFNYTLAVPEEEKKLSTILHLLGFNVRKASSL